MDWNQFKHRYCPVCNANEAKPLYFNKMAVLGGFDMSYRVSVCRECHFVYASDLPESSVYENYYQALSKYDVMTSVDQIRQVDRLRAEAAVQLCKPFLTEQAVIADIGCGSGHLLSAFKDAGWHALYGIDPAPNAAAKAEILFGQKNVCSGTLQDAAQRLPLQDAALICMTGVLEHLPDLHADLNQFVIGLSEGAMLLIEVPALERFIREPMEFYGEFSLEHIQYFSQKTLSQLMAGLGYVCIDSRIVALRSGITDSIFALFSRIKRRDTPKDFTSFEIQNYIAKSEEGMRKLLEGILNCRAEQVIVYGAGSHSARLLPRLEEVGLLSKVIGVVDANPNLHGQQFGDFDIFSPEKIAHWPDATIFISSFAAQDSIESYIKTNFSNPVLRLYP